MLWPVFMTVVLTTLVVLALERSFREALPCVFSVSRSANSVCGSSQITLKPGLVPTSDLWARRSAAKVGMLVVLPLVLAAVVSGGANDSLDEAAMISSGSSTGLWSSVMGALGQRGAREDFRWLDEEWIATSRGASVPGSALAQVQLMSALLGTPGAVVGVHEGREWALCNSSSARRGEPGAHYVGIRPAMWILEAPGPDSGEQGGAAPASSQELAAEGLVRRVAAAVAAAESLARDERWITAEQQPNGSKGARGASVGADSVHAALLKALPLAEYREVVMMAQCVAPGASVALAERLRAAELRCRSPREVAPFAPDEEWASCVLRRAAAAGPLPRPGTCEALARLAGDKLAGEGPAALQKLLSSPWAEYVLSQLVAGQAISRSSVGVGTVSHDGKTALAPNPPRSARAAPAESPWLRYGAAAPLARLRTLAARSDDAMFALAELPWEQLPGPLSDPSFAGLSEQSSDAWLRSRWWWASAAAILASGLAWTLGAALLVSLPPQRSLRELRFAPALRCIPGCLTGWSLTAGDASRVGLGASAFAALLAFLGSGLLASAAVAGATAAVTALASTWLRGKADELLEALPNAADHRCEAEFALVTSRLALGTYGAALAAVTLLGAEAVLGDPGSPAWRTARGLPLVACFLLVTVMHQTSLRGLTWAPVTGEPSVAVVLAFAAAFLALYAVSFVAPVDSSTAEWGEPLVLGLAALTTAPLQVLVLSASALFVGLHGPVSAASDTLSRLAKDVLSNHRDSEVLSDELEAAQSRAARWPWGCARAALSCAGAVSQLGRRAAPVLPRWLVGTDETADAGEAPPVGADAASLFVFAAEVVVCSLISVPATLWAMRGGELLRRFLVLNSFAGHEQARSSLGVVVLLLAASAVTVMCVIPLFWLYRLAVDRAVPLVRILFRRPVVNVDVPAHIFPAAHQHSIQEQLRDIAALLAVDLNLYRPGPPAPRGPAARFALPEGQPDGGGVDVSAAGDGRAGSGLRTASADSASARRLRRPAHTAAADAAAEDDDEQPVPPELAALLTDLADPQQSSWLQRRTLWLEAVRAATAPAALEAAGRRWGSIRVGLTAVMPALRLLLGSAPLVDEQPIRFRTEGRVRGGTDEGGRGGAGLAGPGAQGRPQLSRATSAGGSQGGAWTRHSARMAILHALGALELRDARLAGGSEAGFSTGGTSATMHNFRPAAWLVRRCTAIIRDRRGWIWEAEAALQWITAIQKTLALSQHLLRTSALSLSVGVELAFLGAGADAAMAAREVSLAGLRLEVSRVHRMTGLGGVPLHALLHRRTPILNVGLRSLTIDLTSRSAVPVASPLRLPSLSASRGGLVVAEMTAAIRRVLRAPDHEGPDPLRRFPFRRAVLVELRLSRFAVERGLAAALRFMPSLGPLARWWRGPDAANAAAGPPAADGPVAPDLPERWTPGAIVEYFADALRFGLAWVQMAFDEGDIVAVANGLGFLMDIAARVGALVEAGDDEHDGPQDAGDERGGDTEIAWLRELRHDCTALRRLADDDGGRRPAGPAAAMAPQRREALTLLARVRERAVAGISHFLSDQGDLDIALGRRLRDSGRFVPREEGELRDAAEAFVERQADEAERPEDDPGVPGPVDPHGRDAGRGVLSARGPALREAAERAADDAVSESLDDSQQQWSRVWGRESQAVANRRRLQAPGARAAGRSATLRDAMDAADRVLAHWIAAPKAGCASEDDHMAVGDDDGSLAFDSQLASEWAVSGALALGMPEWLARLEGLLAVAQAHLVAAASVAVVQFAGPPTRSMASERLLASASSLVELTVQYSRHALSFVPQLGVVAPTEQEWTAARLERGRLDAELADMARGIEADGNALGATVGGGTELVVVLEAPSGGMLPAASGALRVPLLSTVGGASGTLAYAMRRTRAAVRGLTLQSLDDEAARRQALLFTVLETAREAAEAGRCFEEGRTQRRRGFGEARDAARTAMTALRVAAREARAGLREPAPPRVAEELSLVERRRADIRNARQLLARMGGEAHAARPGAREDVERFSAVVDAAAAAAERDAVAAAAESGEVFAFRGRTQIGRGVADLANALLSSRDELLRPSRAWESALALWALMGAREAGGMPLASVFAGARSEINALWSDIKQLVTRLRLAPLRARLAGLGRGSAPLMAVMRLYVAEELLAARRRREQAQAEAQAEADDGLAGLDGGLRAPEVQDAGWPEPEGNARAVTEVPADAGAAGLGGPEEEDPVDDDGQGPPAVGPVADGAAAAARVARPAYEGVPGAALPDAGGATILGQLMRFVPESAMPVLHDLAELSARLARQLGPADDMPDEEFSLGGAMLQWAHTHSASLSLLVEYLSRHAESALARSEAALYRRRPAARHDAAAGPGRAARAEGQASCVVALDVACEALLVGQERGPLNAEALAEAWAGSLTDAGRGDRRSRLERIGLALAGSSADDLRSARAIDSVGQVLGSAGSRDLLRQAAVLAATHVEVRTDGLAGLPHLAYRAAALACSRQAVSPEAQSIWIGATETWLSSDVRSRPSPAPPAAAASRESSSRPRTMRLDRPEPEAPENDAPGSAEGRDFTTEDVLRRRRNGGEQ